MSAKKLTTDLSGLVSTKGNAVPVANVPTRSAAPAEHETEENNVPLNFRVTAELRRRFRMFAAAHDLKLNELLRLAFDEYEKKHQRS
ncbi:ribbon-helix-helix protein [Chitinimonas sp. PSY-7]|uniref:ribbon-helix-helix protein n=1 Tax=Chitinimonas sp. PSY-7 TaxID=3459088 RepID=UPI004040157C